MAAPSIKTMEIHFDSKHPKETFDAARCTNKIAANGGAVRGQDDEVLTACVLLEEAGVPVLQVNWTLCLARAAAS